MQMVIVDNASFSGKLLSFIFTERGDSAVVVESVDEAFEESIDRGANAVLVNSQFNGGIGIDLCRDLRAESYNGPLLIWGERNLNDIMTAYNYGVDDYLIDPVDPVEAAARVDAVIRRCKRIDDHLLGLIRVGDAELSIGKLTFKAGDQPPVSLTPIEMRILECLMRNSRIVVGVDTVLRWAWGYDIETDSNRVHVYMMRLRRKIEKDRSLPQYIHTVRGVGYTFRPPDLEHEVSNITDLPLEEFSATANFS